jgi:hypothetical protein
MRRLLADTSALVAARPLSIVRPLTPLHLQVVDISDAVQVRFGATEAAVALDTLVDEAFMPASAAKRIRV